MSNTTPEWVDNEDLDDGIEPVAQDIPVDADEVSDDELIEVEQTTVINPAIEGEAGTE